MPGNRGIERKERSLSSLPQAEGNRIATGFVHAASLSGVLGGDGGCSVSVAIIPQKDKHPRARSDSALG